MSPHTQRQQHAGLSSYLTLRRLGAAVMIRRLGLDLGQADLAARIGVPTAAVDAIEQGCCDSRTILPPRLETALAMSPGTIGYSTRDDIHPSTGRQRTEQPR